MVGSEFPNGDGNYAATVLVSYSDGTKVRGRDRADDRVGITLDQSAGRQALVDLIERSQRIVTDRAPWVPDRVRVLQLDPGRGDAADSGGPRAWPGPPFASFLTEPGYLGSVACGVVSGDVASTLADADARSSGYRWDDHGDVRTLVLRPLLPHEQPCAR